MLSRDHSMDMLQEDTAEQAAVAVDGQPYRFGFSLVEVRKDLSFERATVAQMIEILAGTLSEQLEAGSWVEERGVFVG